MGGPFNVAYYENHAPSQPRPYYAVQIMKSASTFKTNPQDVVILVHAYFQVTLLFEDMTHDNRVVASHRILARHEGGTMDYPKLGRKYLASHPSYRLISPVHRSIDPHNDATFVTGATEIMYVESARNQASGATSNNAAGGSRSHLVTGKLIYKDKKTGNVMNTAKIHGSRDSRIDYNHYKGSQFLPSGYCFAGIDANTGHFLEPNASYVILVEKKIQQVTALIMYKDIGTGSTRKVTPVTGPEGMSLNLQTYVSTRELPKNSRFVKIADGTSYSLRPNARYVIYVRTKRSAMQVTARVLYQDLNSNRIKRSKLIQGWSGQSISKYTSKNSKYIPKGYKFMDLISNNDSQLKANAIYIVLIQRSHGPRVTGQILYRDLYTGQVLKMVHITGPQRLPIDYGHYTSRKALPNGYSYVKLSNRNSSYLEPNMNYDILVKADVSKQSQRNKQQQQTNNDADLPQLGNQDIGKILMKLSSSLQQLGQALNDNKI